MLSRRWNLHALHKCAKDKNKRANVALRINPAFDGGAHPHLATGIGDSKFGIAADEVVPLAKQAAAAKSLNFVGLSIRSHIAAQINDVRSKTINMPMPRD